MSETKRKRGKQVPASTRNRGKTWTGDEYWHGTINGYSNRACRCDRCRAAWTAKCKSWRQVRRDRLEADPTLAPHGVETTYFNWMCRCEPCTAEHTRRQRIRCEARVARQDEALLARAGLPS